MASDIIRREQNSPKSSPRGSRSPANPRPDTVGTLKTTIALGRNLSIIQTGSPFYMLKELPDDSELTGSTNLMAHHGLEHAYNKFSGKKLREELSSFLPTLPGNIDTPGMQDNSSLRSLIEKPPIVGKELVVLTGASLTGFRLHPGPLPEQYRLLTQTAPKRKKHKKRKKDDNKEGGLQENGNPEQRIKSETPSDSSVDPQKKNKIKKTDEEREKKKKKKEKKEKKKKKEKEREDKGDKQPSVS